METESSDINSGQGNEPSSGFEMNPAWNEALDLIPQTLHSQVAPIFNKWDQGAQTKINEYNEKYSGFDPFIQNGVSPEVLAGAMQLAESLQTDPRGVYDAIATHYKFEQQVQEAIEEASKSDDDDPRFAELSELKNNQQLLARIIMEERRQEAERVAQKQADDDFEVALNAVKEKYPDTYNEDHLLMVMRGKDIMDPMEAMKVLIQMNGGQTQGQSSTPPYAPSVMGSGGNIPVPLHGNKHPSQLTDDETVSAIASMLKATNAQKRIP